MKGVTKDGIVVTEFEQGLNEAIDAKLSEGVGHVKAKIDELDKVVKDNLEGVKYITELQGQIKEIKDKFGEIDGSLKSHNELLSESRAQKGKVHPDEAEQIKKSIIASISDEKLTAKQRELKANFNNATTAAEGANLVQTTIARAIMSIQMAYSVAMQEARIEPMATGQGVLKVPLDLEGAAVSYPGEGVAANASESVFGVATLTPYRRISKLIATRELLDKGAIDILNFFADSHGIAFANDTDKQAFAGTGTPMTGLRAGATLIPKTIAAASFAATGAEIKEGIGLLDNVDLDNLKWYMSHSLYWSYMATINTTVTTSGSLIPYPGIGDAASIAAKQIMGFPVRFTRNDANYPASSTSTSLIFAHLCDLKRSLILSNFGATQFAVSTEATVKDSAGTDVNAWDQGLILTKMEGYFTGFCPDFYTTLTKAAGVAFKSAAG